MKETIKDMVLKALKEEGIDPSLDFVVEHPADLSKGDYSTNVAMAYSKILKQSPAVLAGNLVKKLEVMLSSFISKVEVAGPGFINFHLASPFFTESIKTINEAGQEFGKTNISKGEVWAIEYVSPNPNKAMHLGHLRNSIVGTSFCNILEANGAKVIREMVDNNRGIAIAKAMWGYLVSAKKDGARVEDISYWQSHKDEWNAPAEVGMKPDRFVDEMYVKGSAECENPEADARVRDLVVKWEAKDSAVWELWNVILGFAYAGQKETLARLGATFDMVWHEHEHYEEGKRYVEEGLKKGIFKKLEDGAILTDLESFGLSDTIVQKKDGTSLYITQDIALTDLKKKKHNADHLVWIIGPEQSLALEQMFAVCEQLGIGKKEEFTHLSYGYVSIKGKGKMSSREGNVVYADDVLDEAKSKAKEIMKDRIPEEDIEIISEQIAKAAITYEMLKAGRTRDISFDIESALSFEGDSGPYLQYSHTRASSVLRKAKEENVEARAGEYETISENEMKLTRTLYRFPEVIEEAFLLQAPQLIVTYLTELASCFNSFYANNPILNKEDPETSASRVALVQAFVIVMKNGLDVLGIPTPSRM